MAFVLQLILIVSMITYNEAYLNKKTNMDQKSSIREDLGYIRPINIGNSKLNITSLILKYRNIRNGEIQPHKLTEFLEEKKEFDRLKKETNDNELKEKLKREWDKIVMYQKSKEMPSKDLSTEKSEDAMLKSDLNFFKKFKVSHDNDSSDSSDEPVMRHGDNSPAVDNDLLYDIDEGLRVSWI